MNDVRILTTHYDTLRYEDGEGRVVEFNCPSTVEPLQVRVAGAATWAKDTPVWAHDRREEIVGRLRQAGAVVFEREGELTIVQSVKGGFRIEMERVRGKGTAVAETTRVVMEGTGEVLTELPGYGVREPVRFPREGVVALTLEHGSRATFQVEVDVGRRVFAMLPKGGERVLAGLMGELKAHTP